MRSWPRWAKWAFIVFSTASGAWIAYDSPAEPLRWRIVAPFLLGGIAWLATYYNGPGRSSGLN